MAQSDIDVCNRALGRAGGEPIASFDEETPLAAYCAQNWPAKRAWLLGKYRWVFAKAILPLTQLATAPAGCPLPYAFARPQLLVGAIHGVWDSPDERLRCPVRSDQLADYVAADRTPVWAEITEDRPPDAWPPWFEEFAVVAFGVDLARKMMRRTLAGELYVEAFGTPEMLGQGGLFLQAMQNDGRNAPPRTLQYAGGGDLVSARFGYGVGPGLGNGPAWPNNGFPFVIVTGG